MPDGLRPVPQDAESHDEKAEADDGRSQGLVFAVPVVVVGVFGLRRKAHEHQNDDVRHKVRQRMDGIGQHSRAVSHDARKKLEEQQQEVHHTAHDGHFVNFPFASGCLIYKTMQR